MTDVEFTESNVALRIGATVRAHRESAQLSTRELAARCGISQPFLSQIEKGLREPSMSTIYRIAQALNVRPGALLPSDVVPFTLVRADRGTTLPVADRPDAASMRIVSLQDNDSFAVYEYMVAPGEYLEEWFTSHGTTGVYIVSGQVEVEIAGAGRVTLGERDYLSFPAGSSERWLLIGDRPAHVICMVADQS